MLLSNKFFERPGPHARGEWRSCVCSVNLQCFLKKVLHVRNYDALLVQAILSLYQDRWSDIALERNAACNLNAR